MICDLEVFLFFQRPEQCSSKKKLFEDEDDLIGEPHSEPEDVNTTEGDKVSSFLD